MEPFALVGGLGVLQDFDEIGKHAAAVAVIAVAQEAGIDGRDIDRIHAGHDHDERRQRFQHSHPRLRHQ